MKRFIALTSLLGVACAFGQTTETNLKTKKKSFLEKVNTSYYGELYTARLVESEKETLSENGTALYNSLIVNYDHDSDNRFTVTIRHELTDKIPGNGEGDRFDEADPRFAYRRKLLSNDKVTWFGGVMMEAPVSRYSNYEQGDQRIARARLTTLLIATINDYNQFIFWGGLQKTAYKFNSDSYTDDPIDIIYTWSSWSTSALSEKYKLRVDLETATAHMDGKGDLDFMVANGSERILAGVNFDVGSVNLYPFVYNDPSLVKAADKLGAGVQIFKAF